MFNKSGLTALLIGAVAFLNSQVHAVPFKACKPGYFALTFNDGPYVYTSELSKLLKNEGVSATFFINGNYYTDLDVDKGSIQVVQQTFSDGHQLASHTWSHKRLTTLSDVEFNTEISKVENFIKTVSGKKPTCIRPPNGDLNDAVVTKLESRGYSIIEQNFDIGDALGLTNAQIKADIDSFLATASLSEGYIVLAHDVNENTVHDSTMYLISQVKKYGFKFATVAECHGISPYRD